MFVADPFIIKRSRQGHDERSLHVPRVLGSFVVREVARQTLRNVSCFVNLSCTCMRASASSERPGVVWYDRHTAILFVGGGIYITFIWVFFGHAANAGFANVQDSSITASDCLNHPHNEQGKVDSGQRERR